MAADDPDAGDLAYLIAVGNRRFHHAAHSAVTALRQLGKFAGQIVLLTDRDRQPPPDCRVVRVRDPALLAEPKRIKLHLADFVDPADWRRVMFMDADVAAARPFFDDIRAAIDAGALVCTDDIGQSVDAGLSGRLLNDAERATHGGRSLGVNSGFFAGSGTRIADWLQTWEDLLDANRHLPGDGFDQPALNAAMLRGLLPVCTIRGLMWFPRFDPDQRTCIPDPPLVHFHGAGRKWRRAWRMRRFVRRAVSTTPNA